MLPGAFKKNLTSLGSVQGLFYQYVMQKLGERI